jgi:hypothetical protein
MAAHSEGGIKSYDNGGAVVYNAVPKNITGSWKRNVCYQAGIPIQIDGIMLANMLQTRDSIFYVGKSKLRLEC